jgi:hypothetical protein
LTDHAEAEEPAKVDAFGVKLAQHEKGHLLYPGSGDQFE